MNPFLRYLADKNSAHRHTPMTTRPCGLRRAGKNAVTVSSYPPPSLTSSARILYIACYLKTFISYYMLYTLHVVELLRYDSVLIKETNEMKSNV